MSYATADLHLAIAHHLLIFVLAGILAFEIGVIHLNITRHDINRVGRIDAWYGICALVIIVAGFLRAIFAAQGWVGRGCSGWPTFQCATIPPSEVRQPSCAIGKSRSDRPSSQTHAREHCRPRRSQPSGKGAADSSSCALLPCKRKYRSAADRAPIFVTDGSTRQSARGGAQSPGRA
jgi:hypothetical protein